MSDAVETPAPAPVAAPAEAAPAPAAAAPAPAPAPAKPRALNPWAKRAPAAAPVAVTPADPAVAALSTQVESLRGLVARQADEALNSAPESVRAYVAKVAGDDPAKRLDALHALRAAGLVPTTVPAGATTAPAMASPSTVPTPNPDAVLLAEHERLSSSSPMLAAAFAARNGAALTRARAAKTSRN